MQIQATTSTTKPANKAATTRKPKAHSFTKQAPYAVAAGSSAAQLHGMVQHVLYGTPTPTLLPAPTPAAVTQTPAPAGTLQAQIAAMLAAGIGQAKPPKAPKVSKPRVQMPTQNGVTMPAPNTACGMVWAAAAQITAAQGSTATSAQVQHVCQLQGINPATCKTQYARWRAYHGIAGRITLAVPAPATAQ